MANNTPLIPQSVRLESVTLSSAGADRNATPTNKLFTAGANGSRVEKVECMTTNGYGVSTISKLLRLYINYNGIYYLYRELNVIGLSLLTVSNMTPPEVFYFPGGLNMAANQELWGSLSTYSTAGDNLIVTVHAKDF